MDAKVAAHCIHLDQELRWFGYREDHGCKLYVFQCLGCGRTFASRTALVLKGAAGPQETLTGHPHA
jgi:hypothetical protein